MASASYSLSSRASLYAHGNLSNANKFPKDNLLARIVPLNIAFANTELFIKSIFDIKQKAFILANKHLADNFIVLKYIGGCRLIS